MINTVHRCECIEDGGRSRKSYLVKSTPASRLGPRERALAASAVKLAAGVFVMEKEQNGIFCGRRLKREAKRR